MGQILIQVSAFHVLGDHAERIAADTHPQETDDVGVLQAGQDLHLFQEVVSAGRGRENTWFILQQTLGKGSEPRLQLCLAFQMIRLLYRSACLTNCPIKAVISAHMSSSRPQLEINIQQLLGQQFHLISQDSNISEQQRIWWLSRSSVRTWRSWRRLDAESSRLPAGGDLFSH